MRACVILLIGIAATSLAHAQPAIERQGQLRDLLRDDCGACHGMTRKGGLGLALTPEALRGKPDELLIGTILDGRAGTAMPPWRRFLTADEAAWLVALLRREEPSTRDNP